MIMLVVDDLNTPAACGGEPKGVRPNLDIIASQSSTYLQAFAQVPVCGPSRVSFLTGRLPGVTGVYDYSGVRHAEYRGEETKATFLRYLEDEGFDVKVYGKVAHSQKNVDMPSHYFRGDDPYGSHNVVLCNISGNDRPSAYTVPDSERTRSPGNCTGPLQSTIIADAIINDLANRDVTKRFAYAAGFTKPHLPWSHYEQSMAVIRGLNVTLPCNFDKACDVDRGVNAASACVNYEFWRYDPDRRGDLYRMFSTSKIVEHRMAYMASVHSMDHDIGRVWNYVNHSGLLSNTIVWVLSDHGFSLGEFGLWCKHRVFERDTHVPLTLYVPGQSPSVYSHPVELLDIAPTTLRLLGFRDRPCHSACEYSATLCTDGRIIFPHTNLRPKSARSEYLYYSPMAYSLVTPDGMRLSMFVYMNARSSDQNRLATTWSQYYSRYQQGGAPQIQLYNITADPSEAENLAFGDPSTVALLSTEMQTAFPQCTGQP